jgi:hypothetical protein
MRGLHLHRLLLPLLITAIAGVLSSHSANSQAQIRAQIHAQILAPAKPAASVRISKGPELESVRGHHHVDEQQSRGYRRAFRRRALRHRS